MRISVKVNARRVWTVAGMLELARRIALCLLMTGALTVLGLAIASHDRGRIATYGIASLIMFWAAFLLRSADGYDGWSAPEETAPEPMLPEKAPCDAASCAEASSADPPYRCTQPA